MHADKQTKLIKTWSLNRVNAIWSKSYIKRCWTFQRRHRLELKRATSISVLIVCMMVYHIRVEKILLHGYILTESCRKLMLQTWYVTNVTFDVEHGVRPLYTHYSIILTFKYDILVWSWTWWIIDPEIFVFLTFYHWTFSRVTSNI